MEFNDFVDKATVVCAYVSMFLAAYIVAIEFVLPSYVGMRYKKEKKSRPTTQKMRMIKAYDRFKGMVASLDSLGDGDSASTGTKEIRDKIVTIRKRKGASAKDTSPDIPKGDEGQKGKGRGKSARKGKMEEDPFAVDWHSRLVDPLDDPTDGTEDVDALRIDQSAGALFLERAQSLLPPDVFGELATAFSRYEDGSLGFDTLVAVSASLLIRVQCWDLLGWFQVLAPSGRHLIRMHRVVEITREERPSECEEMPLFTDMLPLVYVLGSPKHPPSLRHAAAVGILEQLTNCPKQVAAVQPAGENQDEMSENANDNNNNNADEDEGGAGKQSSIFDMRVPNVFLASRGLDVLMALSRTSGDFRHVTRAVLRRMMAMAIANGANGDPDAFLTHANKASEARDGRVGAQGRTDDD